ncbi:MAG: biotin--[acetyl-CoA-carboxylase] ligase [Candidatus Omnitrophica bacterium]|nr:biotin--[acetyl-CoA-carboxylase] ligase [Candidatus Omnitrophota bacterium]MDD5238130.1 biotin--[acetyl-CoA-carboxylase] ligase [Candidatus Omnitrophota bacterium]
MQEKILDFLSKKQGYVSGDQISHRLGVTRQALWKHIQELKNLGYEIVAVPHLGYRLDSCPDRLFPYAVTRELNTHFLGKKVYYFDSVSSTMDTAMQLGMKGNPSGTLVLAESQTKGRGRLGRNWFSPKYKGIYLSLILKPRVLPARASMLTLLSAVSICEAIKEMTGIDTQIKWPNDILAGQKKLGGILTELVASVDEINFVIIGIGLNVNNDKKMLISAATSLKEQKKEFVNRITLLQELLRKIEVNYLLLEKEGSESIIEKWRRYNITLGKRVKVYCQREHIEGEAVDIDTDGGLLVRKDSGIIEKVMAGDVVHAR